MTPSPHRRGDYECIDPALGAMLGGFDDPDLDAATREQLETHVVHCAACRYDLAFQREVEAGLDEGLIDLASTKPLTGSLAGWIGFGGALALAASLVMILLLPASWQDRGRILRGEEGPAILRPVADAVILDRRPTVSWTLIEGARGYEVTLEDANGPYSWTGRAMTTSHTLDEQSRLPSPARIRVHIVPIPASLAESGGLRSSFRTGGAAAVFAYRVGTATPWIWILGLAGLFALTAAFVLRVRSHRA